MTAESSSKPKHKKRRRLKIFLIVVAVLVIIRLILPYVVLHYANKTLAEMKGYYGHIDDIDLHIYRGAYAIKKIYINEVDSVTKKQTEFFDADKIDLSIEWKALFKGSIVGELEFMKPSVRFTKDRVEPQEVAQDSSDFRQVLDDFMPLHINRFEINDGVILYKDPYSKPRVDLAMTNIYVLAENLRNSYDSSNEILPARVKATADMYDGNFELNMKLNPLEEHPTFDLNSNMKSVNLVKLNDFFQAYAKVDVNKGTFGMYTEVAAKDNKFKGYVKPFIKDLDVLGKEDRKDNLFQKIWEGIAGAGGKILDNQKTDQVATKVDFQGSFDNPDTDVWGAVVELLSNAFIQALQPAIDNQINIGSVNTVEEKEEKKGLLKRVFGKDKKDEKKDEKKK